MDRTLVTRQTGQAGLDALLRAAEGWERALDQSPGGLILLAVFATTLIFAVLSLKRDRAHD
jgi:hypothetical protein